MDTVESLRAERDAALAERDALKKQKELHPIFGGPHGRVSRNVFDAMTPGARAAFTKSGGEVV